MYHICLYQPEIAPNTGNIIRLCANAGSQLHLIHPLGFDLDDKKLRRAGLDYREWASVKEYRNYQEFIEQFPGERLFAVTTKACEHYHEMNYHSNDGFLFGPETRGLPEDVRASLPCIRIPMQPDSRSLNLSNSVAIVLFEAWRQGGFVLK